MRNVDLFADAFVRGVYHGELMRFEKGIYGRLKESAPDKFLEKQIEKLADLTANRVPHLQKCIQHLSKGRQKQVVICIDNSDQRELQDQQRAFLAAQEFAVCGKRWYWYLFGHVPISLRRIRVQFPLILSEF